MEFTFEQAAANIRFGRGCVAANAKDWVLGKRAYIIAGGKSARLSGALFDVEDALRKNNIPYAFFEGVENNPSLEQCRMLGQRAMEFGADFLVAIGGGSPMDAAKAVAVFALEDVQTETLFQNAFKSALPIVAIPTTSGTGSEVTPYSVLTRKDMETKRSFGNRLTLPAFALLDPGYTDSLPQQITLDTAMDAFTHCFESILSIRATPITDALNIHALGRFRACMDALEQGALHAIRDELMLISLFGGLTITHTGTTVMHGMGYPLTYYHGFPHGAANCAVMKGYLARMRAVAPKRLDVALGALGMDEAALVDFVQRNYHFKLALTKEERAHYAAQSETQGSARNTPGTTAKEDIAWIYEQAGL